MGRKLFAVVRGILVSAMFLSLWLWFIPRWIAGPDAFSSPRSGGFIILAAGLAVMSTCMWEFAWRGLGTPAPFDPPRRLVVTGLYRFVRNPMYVGGALAIAGEAAAFPRLTGPMLVVLAVFWIFTNGFIFLYEEPALRRTFGPDYDDYCRHVRRWTPRLTPFDKGRTAA